MPRCFSLLSGNIQTGLAIAIAPTACMHNPGAPQGYESPCAAFRRRREKTTPGSPPAAVAYENSNGGADRLQRGDGT